LEEESSYATQQYGGGFRFGFRLDENSTVGTKYSFLHRDVEVNDDEDVSRAILDAEGTSIKSMFGLNYTYDQLDNPLKPTSGYRLQSMNEFAGIGGDVRYASTGFLGQQVTEFKTMVKTLHREGIEVILDQWSLEDGHDINAFMERMVTDPTIKRVIIICDALYADKADGRKGGVGSETQIISKEVYDRVDQTKFVPVLRERNVDDTPSLPVFLKSRKYIDFSNVSNEAEAYDQLLRNVFERPRRRRPRGSYRDRS
jgi:hypothetical protein